MSGSSSVRSSMFDGFGRVSYRITHAQEITDAASLEGGPEFRIAMIALGVINVAAAAFMFGNILYDAWTVRPWDFETKRQKYFSWLLKIHPAEMFPLIISGSVILQGSILIPIQAVHVQSILFQGCGKIVQLVFPALWLTFSTMLVFGLETTFQSLRRIRFPSRNRWQTPCALVIIALMIIAAWAATNIFPTRGKCLTGLIWWTARYAKLAVVLASGLLAIYPVSAVIITVRLMETVKVDKAERIAATRVVYYLVVNTWLVALILPYYIQILTGTSAMRTAQIAEVALNLTGIVNLIMHVLLRSNADRLAIRSVQTPWTDKRTMRVFGPSDLNIREHISYPVLWQEVDQDQCSSIARPEKASERSPTESDCEAYSAGWPLQHAILPSAESNSTRSPTPPLKTTPVRQVTENSASYRIFPNPHSAVAHLSSSTTFSDINDRVSLPLPPAPLFAAKHDRNISSQSGETVQIGLRLSYINHALDPIEASPPSIIGLPSPLQAAEDPNRNTVTRSETLRTSASSESFTDFTIMPIHSRSQALESVGAHSSIPSEEALTPVGAVQQPKLQVPQLLNVPRAVPRVMQAPSQLPKSIKQGSSAQGHRLQPALPLEPAIEPPPAISSQSIMRPQVRIDTKMATGGPAIRDQAIANQVTASSSSSASSNPSGLPTGPKPVPSWRPQDWNRTKYNTAISPKTKTDEDESLLRQKMLPVISTSAQRDSRTPSFINPFVVAKPQAILRPPGWI